MWIARDKNGELWLYEDKPIKKNDLGIWDSMSQSVDVTYIYNANIEWDDEPKEVEIIIRNISE